MISSHLITPNKMSQDVTDASQMGSIHWLLNAMAVPLNAQRRRDDRD
jgi:hypothetical protein